MTNLTNLLEEKKSEPVAPARSFPLVEDLMVKAIIQSDAEGLKLLRAIQIIINEFGAGTICQIMDKLESKPQLMQQAKSYLPYLIKL